LTRINTIPVDRLTDQHLLAEYRELPRVFALARPLTGRERRDTYTLGAGHVLFFYERTGFLARRQAAIIAECLDRGFDIQHRTAPDPIPGLDADWFPTAADHAVSLSRLRDRLAERPGFYRHRGVPVAPDFYTTTETT
jgi:deoxyribonuclease (pyrimidine dimer)